MTVPRLLTVGEAARALGMCRTTLLAAEESGLLVPSRTPGGHRRYDPADLDRFLGRARPAPAPPPTDPAPQAVHLVPAVRAAVRPLARALDAESAGVYLAGEDAGLRFCAAFGVPRWLAERLADTPAPAAVAQAHSARRHRVFDPAEVAFPEPRSTGHGAAVPLCADDAEPVGALFVITRSDRGLLPADLRTVEAFGSVVASLVRSLLRVTELELRLARIAALSG
ncbi:hypothetical protein GCM10017691_56750 [Pseudonocardia petroleophila]|uniref:MerR family transcriptional regulator n=1 Tax=Pseudonocardia petroleophila TaxID=37331 RepID=A0A7G7MNA9_9PSEU|nr:MerR family transcriptional regulator [Pseudonocardia petroleophila]QNG54270.1 MerR family transcriptional regulator [Pseudonocardia petroleophila]